jgi:hypothetical protein
VRLGIAGIDRRLQHLVTKAAFVFGINTLMFGFVAGSVSTLKKGLAIAPVPPSAIVGLVALILFCIFAVLAVGTLIYAVMSRLGELAPKSRVFL